MNPTPTTAPTPDDLDRQARESSELADAAYARGDAAAGDALSEAAAELYERAFVERGLLVPELPPVPVSDR